MSTSYKTAHEIYYSKEVKRNQVGDALFNVYGKFVSTLNSNIIILEDYTLDCHFYIVFNVEIMKQFAQYFEPWFIFRFHRLKFASSCASYNDNAKRVYLNFKEFSSLVVFSAIDLPNRFNFHTSKTATIDELDWHKIDQLRQRFVEKSCIPITDLNQLLETNSKDSINVSFLAQIIEIKQVQLNKIILKVFDGTAPKFQTTHPINQATLKEDFFESIEVHEECDFDLHSKANDKIIFVLIEGESLVLKFNGKKPKNLVHFYNAKMIKTFSGIRIEMKIQASSDLSKRQFIKFIDENSNLGKLLMNRINQSLNEATSRSNSLITCPKVNDFTGINVSNKHYEVYCSIIDLYPLNHIALDLIRMKCFQCDLDETLNNLFDVDLEGIEKATSIYFAQYQKNANMQCPLCSNASCSFYFQIIFYIQDATRIEDEKHRMFAFLSGPDAEAYLDLNPIRVVANERCEQYNLMRKIDYLKEEFSDSPKEFHNRYMIISPDVRQDFYRIKDIFVKLNEQKAG